MLQIQSISDIKAGKYYVGMTTNDLKDNKQRKKFDKIDVNHNSQLSLWEIINARHKNIKRDIVTKTLLPLIIPLGYSIELERREKIGLSKIHNRVTMPLTVLSLIFSASELIYNVRKYQSENKAIIKYFKETYNSSSNDKGVII